MNAMLWAEWNLKTLEDFDAFVFRDRVWRSRAVHDQAARMASGLLAMGVAPGDRVLLWLPNCPELVISWRAVLRAGGVAVAAHHDSPLGRIEQLMAETEPAAIVTSTARFEADSAGPTLRGRIQVDPEERSGWTSFGRIVTEHRPLAEPVVRSGQDVACIEYTSGTTGRPKGTLTRHALLAAKLKSLPRPLAAWQQPSRQLSILPMSSAYGSRPLFEGLGRKCTHYFLDRFDPERVLEAIQKYRIQQMSLVPTMCEALLAIPNIQRYDVSSLRAVFCGGASVPAALVDRFAKAFGIRMQVLYGMTAVGGVSQTSSQSKPGSVGRPYRHLRTKVVDPEGSVLPAGQVGELMLQLSKNTAVEYWNPDASTPAAADAEGWHRTGDLVRFDADGELYVVGRTDDLIIQGGHNIHGQTVAEVVQRLPEVRECAVVGVPNEYLGQEAVACVALRDGARLAAEDVIAHCRQHLDALAAPTSVWFVDALPRNEAGKVKSHELRGAIQAARGTVHETGLLRRLAAAAAPERYDLLRKEVQRVLGTVLAGSGSLHATAAASFQDLGLDSLGAVELTHALSEAIGRPVPPTLTYSHPTVDEACNFLLELMGWPDSRRVVFVDPRASPVVNAEELRLEDFFSLPDLDAARQSMPAPDLRRGAQVVFLTGANGFVGRFLALEILKRLPPEGRLYGLVRAASPSAALERLRGAYGSDPSLQDFLDRQLQSGRLVVLGGDLTQPRFGLPEETYDRLCGEVDCIVHNGAVVDHVLGYRELFAPNVLGTVEIIRLAVAQRIKTINYLSTVAARKPPRNMSVHKNVDFAVGYSTSKWASEKLLKKLHDRLHVPVRIYRPSYIMAHSEAPGQINVQDTLTRLLHGIVVTSLAPRSFYAGGRAAEGVHYDGLPVDTIARSIAALSVAGQIDRPGYVEYNIVNPHHDVSLDVIADWVRSAGYPVEQIDGYGAWYRAFMSRLGSLSRPQRQQSLLPLIHAWKRPIRSSMARYDTTSYRQHLSQISPAAETERPTEAPSITEAFIHKCLRDMRLLGLVDAADDCGPARGAPAAQ